MERSLQVLFCVYSQMRVCDIFSAYNRQFSREIRNIPMRPIDFMGIRSIIENRYSFKF